MPTSRRDDGLTHYTVTYDSANHIKVLTQMTGSKSPEVRIVFSCIVDPYYCCALF
jgi:hypothetical protein